jgi:type IV secretory pathway VirB10-like protein
MTKSYLPLSLLAIVALSACKTPKESEPSPATPSAATATNVAATQNSATAAAPPSAEVPTEAASAEPIASAPPAASAPPEEEPLPNVEVKNIGMHIGGGPNDRETKRPIKESVQPHFDSLRRCWKLVDDPAKPGDFGADLLIPREGGKAEVSHPRSALKGEGFEACIVEVFQKIDFKKPKTGKTMVSYSLRFTPGK